MGNCFSSSNRNVNRFDDIIKPNDGGRRFVVNPGDFVNPPAGIHSADPRISSNAAFQIKEPVTVRALFSYQPRTSEDLPFEAGEELEVDKSFTTSNRDWWFARSRRTGRAGYVPRNYVADVTSLRAEPWYFSDTKRTEAEAKLLNEINIDGCFLIRASETRNNEHSLSVRFNEAVKHYRIKQEETGLYFIARTRPFESLKDLVRHYSHKADGLCIKLKQPCRVIGLPSTGEMSYFTDQNWEIPRSSIKMLEKLGQGAFGEVFRGIWNKTTPVAVKTMKADTMSVNEFLKEAAIMKKLRHRKLIQLYAVCTEREPIYIITELMENGSLLDYLRDERRGHRLQLPQLVDITAQVACGMAYLESQNYIHRDLAARNVLVGEQLDCKVADFGLAREDLYTTGQNEGGKLPIKWTAPEALMYSKFSIKSDVWSFGILMYEVITYGGQPYAGRKGQEVMNAIQNGYRLEKPNNCPENYYFLMKQCWRKDPEERATFEAMQLQLEHYFEEDTYFDEEEH